VAPVFRAIPLLSGPAARAGAAARLHRFREGHAGGLSLQYLSRNLRSVVVLSKGCAERPPTAIFEQV
jgi:hypothetical protein